LINNKWVDSEKGETFSTINPSNEEVLCDVQRASKLDLDKAVIAARNAFEKG
jgi:acyl-CoA reductase-like NAD-dependent aldehyde dehydrogenase